MKWLLAGLLSCTALVAEAQSLSKALVVPSCGTPAPPGSPLSNFTMNTSGRLCSLGGGGGANMTTPILWYDGAPNATITTWSGFFGQVWTNGATVRMMPSPIQGVLANLVVQTSLITTNYLNIGLYINGTLSPLQCSVGQPGGVNPGTTTTCSDPIDQVHVNPGDLLQLQSSVPGGAANQPTFAAIGMTLTSENGQESLIGGGTAGPIATAAISYTGLNQNNISTTDALASSVMPTSGVLDHLYLRQNVAEAGAASKQYTIFKNGVATGIVALCTGGAVLCTDLTHAIAVAPTDTISLQICPGGVAGCPGASTAASAYTNFSLRFSPSTPNQTVLFNVPAVLPQAVVAARYMGVNGATSGQAGSDVNSQNAAPILATHMTLGNLTVAQCPGPDTTGAGGVTRSFTLRANGVNQSPTVAILGNSAAPCPALEIVRDTTDTYQATTGTLLNLVTTLDTITNASALAELKTSMTATVP